MNKTELFKAVIDDIGHLHRSLSAFYAALMEDAGHAEEPEDVSGKVPEITLEEVRSVLAEKSRMGLTGAVRNLLDEFGVDRLSALKPEYYAELLNRAEEL